MTSIKDYVEAKWREGLLPWVIYRMAQQEFPHKCCGWDYVNGICRQLERAKCQSKD